MKKPSSNALTNALWIGLGVLSFGVVLALVWLPEQKWIAAVLLAGIAAVIGTLVYQNRKLFSGRTASYGLNALIYTLITLGFVVLVNFIAVKHPVRWDTTQSKRHTLADQTIKVLKE